METENPVAKVKRETLLACMTCPICHKLFKEATTISECLHTFCRKCIYEKITEEDLHACPVCKADLGGAPLDKLRVDNNWRDLRSKIFPSKKVKSNAPKVSSLPAKKEEASLFSLGDSTNKEPRKPPLAGRRSKITAKRSTAKEESAHQPVDIAEPVNKAEDCLKNVKPLETDSKNAENTMQNHTVAKTKQRNHTAAESSEQKNGTAGESSKQKIPDQITENDTATLDVPNRTVMGPPRTRMCRRRGGNDPEAITRISAVQKHIAAEPSKQLNHTTADSFKQKVPEQLTENHTAPLDVQDHIVMGPPKPRTRSRHGGNDPEEITRMSVVQNDTAAEPSKQLNHTAADSSKQKILEQFTENNAAPLDIQNHLVMGPPKQQKFNRRKGNPPRMFSAQNSAVVESSKQLNHTAADSSMQKNGTTGESSKPDQYTKNRFDEQNHIVMGPPKPRMLNRWGENSAEAMTTIFAVQNPTESSKPKILDQHTENPAASFDVLNKATMGPPKARMLDGLRKINPEALPTGISDSWNTLNNLVDAATASKQVPNNSSEEKTVKPIPFTLFGTQVDLSTVHEFFKEPKVPDNENYSFPPIVKESSHDPKAPSNEMDSKSQPSTSERPKSSRVGQPRKPAVIADLNLPAQPLVDEEERIDVYSRSVPIWFTLVASVDQVGNEPLPQISSRYIRVKNRNLTVSYIKKYIVQKLGLFSEDEVEISLRGEPLVSTLQLDHLVDWWVNTTPLSERRESAVGGSAKDFVMELSYSRKALTPIVISD